MRDSLAASFNLSPSWSTRNSKVNTLFISVKSLENKLISLLCSLFYRVVYWLVGTGNGALLRFMTCPFNSCQEWKQLYERWKNCITRDCFGLLRWLWGKMCLPPRLTALIQPKGPTLWRQLTPMSFPLTSTLRPCYTYNCNKHTNSFCFFLNEGLSQCRHSFPKSLKTPLNTSK